jgi:hypothetical protein
MASASYQSLLSLASHYLEERKAAEILLRQLERSNLHPDTVSLADVRAAANRLGIALSLYVADARKRDELLGKLKAL